MHYNNLPGTSVKLSLLCLGTMMFGGQIEPLTFLQPVRHSPEVSGV